MPLLLSMQKSLPQIFRQFQRSCLIKNSTNEVTTTRSVPNFPTDQKWFDRANKIISNQFGSTLSSSIESNFTDSRNVENVVQQIASNELLSAIAIMQERIGDKENKTILDIKRKCRTGIGLNNFFQGTSILLMSCIDRDQVPVTATTTTPNLDSAKCDQSTILDQQLTLAKLTEMLYFTTVLHNQISDAKNCDHVENKILITLGDYILAQILFRLTSLDQPDLTSLFLTILQYKSEAFFYDAGKSRELTFKNWIDMNHKNFAHLFACNFNLVFKLAKIEDQLLRNVAFEFGKNLGLAIRAFQDVNWAVENEMPFKATIQVYSNTKLKHDNLANVQVNQELINNLRVVQQVFCANALTNLELLPLQDDAKECFHILLDRCNEISNL